MHQATTMFRDKSHLLDELCSVSSTRWLREHRRSYLDVTSVLRCDLYRVVYVDALYCPRVCCSMVQGINSAHCLRHTCTYRLRQGEGLIGMGSLVSVVLDSDGTLLHHLSGVNSTVSKVCTSTRVHLVCMYVLLDIFRALVSSNHLPYHISTTY